MTLEAMFGMGLDFSEWNKRDNEIDEGIDRMGKLIF